MKWNSHFQKRMAKKHIRPKTETKISENRQWFEHKPTEATTAVASTQQHIIEYALLCDINKNDGKNNNK